MHYVVAGTGYTGRRVMAELPVGEAIGLNRSIPDAIAHEVRRVDLDGEDDAALGFSTPYTLLYTIPPRPDGDRDTRLAGLLSRLRPLPVRVVYLSTSGVYGDRRGARTDESTRPRPKTSRARRRLAAEHLLGRWCEDNGVECLILRVPGIYGPGRLGIDRLRAGDAVLCDADAGPGNRIQVEDLVRCCLAAMTSDAPAGIYNVGDGDHRASGAFSRLVARIAGLDAPAEISLAEAGRTWSDMRLSFLGESRRLDTTRMREVLGVIPRYADPEDGIRASLADPPP